MSNMFVANNAQAAGIAVKGDIIEQPAQANKIKTRSQTKKNPEQYTAIPFPAKAIKLLLWDFKTNLENTVSAATASAPASQNEPESDLLDGEEASSDVGDWEDLDEESPFGSNDDLAYLAGENNV